MKENSVKHLSASSRRAVRILQKTADGTARALAFFGGAAVLALLALVCANAGSRLAGMPIRGAVECSGILGAVIASLALSSAQVHGNHITGGIAADRLPRALRLALSCFCHAAGCLFFLLCAWEVADIGLFALETGETIDGLGALYPWFVLLTVPGFFGEAAVLACRLFICLISGRD
ncbi:MAG: TRAP transporter small permease subunit [Mailhella sp.]|nr:TRAP transporter small permease subunit [Mailhella sp.]